MPVKVSKSEIENARDTSEVTKTPNLPVKRVAATISRSMFENPKGGALATIRASCQATRTKKGTRRDKKDIAMAILGLAREPKGKTAITYQANLSFKCATDHLMSLVAKGFVLQYGTKYQTTSKGWALYETLKTLCTTLEELKLP